MTTLKLVSMSIDNFKGIKHLEIKTPDGVTMISGKNGTGKSSIVDAFTWCLFNRDSHGNAAGSDSFREKPLDDDGNEVHNLDTTVELKMELDFKPFNVKRTQRENWVKKRGNVDAVYQGNNSTYWINDVETKQSEFKAQISKITSEDLFRILGTLSEFNRIDWKKRRAMLIELCDKDIDKELLERQEYQAIKEEIEARSVSVDDLRKIMQDRKRAINDELKTLPIRIDECQSQCDAFDRLSIADSEYLVKESLEDIAKIDEQIAAAMADDPMTANRVKLEALMKELVGMKKVISQEHEAKRWQVSTRLDDIKAREKKVSGEADRLSDKIKALYAAKDETEAKCEKLRNDYKVRHAEKYVDKVEDICPTCKRPLDENDLEAAREAARKAFSDKKKADLEIIKEKGLTVAQRVKDINKDIEETEKQLGEVMDELSAITTDSVQASDELSKLPMIPDYSVNPEIAEIEDQINQIRAQGVQADVEGHIARLKERKAELQAKVREHQEKLAKAEVIKETRARIEELKGAQKAAGQRLIDTEHMIDLLDSYTQDRCGALEESINGHFERVRWKLFDTQINGGLVDTCMCMIPCASGLVAYNSANTASQINADIEIINTLSDHYGVRIPLFVDNAERVNSLRSTATQMIMLSVSDDDELKVA